MDCRGYVRIVPAIQPRSTSTPLRAVASDDPTVCSPKRRLLMEAPK